MNRLQKLLKLTDYLSKLRMTASDGCDTVDVEPIMTTAQADATSKLGHRSGVQVLIARPEENQTGNSDYHRDYIGTAIFVLEKGLGLDKTMDLENVQYRKLLLIADAILGKIADDTSGNDCNLVSGLSLSSVQITPEASLFGGWSGWSVELSFE